MKCDFCGEEAWFVDKVFGPAQFRCCDNESCREECAYGCFDAMMEEV